MIDGLKPYPQYKDSGLLWLGKIPAHWETNRLKNWTVMNARALPESTPSDFHFGYLDIGSVTTGRLAQTPQPIRFGDAPSRARRILTTGDTIVSTVRTYLKAVYTYEGGHDPLVASTGFAVLTPREGTHPRFVGYLAQSAKFTDQVTSESIGIAYPAISETRLGNIAIALPPPEEQAAIVRFLDHANAKIERAVRAKRKLIGLLNEQKQAIIHRAVTRGLDPAVKLKPSGIPWLGDMPAVWDMCAFGRCISGIDQGWSPVAAEGELDEYQWAVLTLSCMSRGLFRANAIKPISKQAKVPIGMAVSDGELLMSRSNTRQLVGDCCIVKGARPRTILCDLIYRIHLRSELMHPRFVLYWLLSPAARRQIETDARGSSSTMVKISHSHIKRWRILVPDLPTQIAIVEAIDDTTRPIDTAISRAEREIELLREYRTTLTADVVTGKLDVREAARMLPTTPDEPPPAEDEADAPELDEADE